MLRAYAAGLYRAHWSEQLLEEVERNLAEDFVGPERAASLVRRLREYFPEAALPRERYESLIEAMTNHPKDRHVLAVAVAAGVDVIVTRNLRDFPAQALEPHGVEAQSPDDFLVNLFDLDPTLMVRLIESQAADLKNPPATVERVLDNLAIDAPRFAAHIRSARRT
jgi:predicted nucleic acid-binding protein